jgi:hypothetical protein
MLSRQVPFGLSKQSWDCADGAPEYILIGEDECHDTPTLEEDFEPNAIFAPEWVASARSLHFLPHTNCAKTADTLL